MRTDRRAFLIGTAAAALTLGRRPSSAAVDESAWKRIVDDARKEGEVALYSSGIARMEEPRMKEFEAQTGVKVRYARPGGGEIVIRKFETEIAAGRPRVDVCTLTDTALGLYAHDKGWTVEAQVPNLARLDPAYPIATPHVVPTGAFGLIVAHNTKRLPIEKAPRSYADLARPEFKDQILLGAPENAGSTTLLIKAWVEKYGWAFVEKLRANNVAEMRLQAEAMQAVSRGEKSICVVSQSWAFTNITQGAPVNVVWPSDGTVMADTVLFVARGAPHANAALVLANHLISSDYQSRIGPDTGAYGSAAGVAGPPGFPKLAEVKAYRPNLRELERTRGDIIDRWRKIMS